MTLVLPSHHAAQTHFHRSLRQYENEPQCQNSAQVTENHLPSDFPRHLTSALNWSGTELVDDRQYTYYLTDTDKSEIDAALANFRACEIDGDLVDKDNFPLPNLQFVLRRLAFELHNGKGFFVLRGIDHDKHTVEDTTVIFLGLQSYIAEKRARQDHMGNMIVHIIADYTPSSSPLKPVHTRHSNSSISFHTDHIGDVLAFQTRSTATRGGKCILASTHKIYNELAAARPDIIRTLASPNWPVALPHYHERPILFYHDSHIVFNFFPGALLGSAAHPRPKSIPSLSSSQVEALSVLQALAEKHRLEVSTRAGDLHFVNNLAVLHRRDAFELEEGSRRHLVRMWLRNATLGWAVPEILEGGCGWREAYREDGEKEEVWHLEPMPEYYFPLRKYQN